MDTVHTRRGHGLLCLTSSCRRTFGTPSAVAQHVESGYHGINRHQVTAAVQSLKIAPAITVRQSIEAPPSARSQQPHSSSVWYTIPLACNSYACKCHICHRTFRSMIALTAHLNSPVHDIDEFKCPQCRKTFKLISGLVQHIESGCCHLAQTRQVLGYYNNFVTQFSRALTWY